MVSRMSQYASKNANCDSIRVRGGRSLKGTIDISGAKNAALPIMAASLLTEKEVIIHNVPRSGDVLTMKELVRSVGASIEFENNTLRIRASKLTERFLPENYLASEIRYSLHIIGALLPRLRRVKMPIPGGCKLGTRRLDSFLMGLTSLGAKFDVNKKYMRATLDSLHGCHVKLEFPSVSATENMLIVGSVAEGNSVVENVAKEPEIEDLADFLNSMGAEIRGAGTDVIHISGVRELSGTEHTIIPDRIETGTYAVAAALTNGETVLRKTNLSLLESVVSKLREIGVGIEEVSQGIRVSAPSKLHSVDIVTEIYPGFPTDMQPIITPLLCKADGISKIKETVFDRRFNHVPELRKMGARIEVEGDTLFIKGECCLTRAEVEAPDMRSGASLLLAALAAEGTTTIRRAHQIFRGYEQPLEKLKKLGAETSKTKC